MPSTTMTSKGQITIPKHIRDNLGLKPGDVVNFGVSEQGEIVIRPVDETVMRQKREEYRKRLERVTGIVSLGMSVDEYMKMIRGDD